jgi:acyl carrier protein
MISTFERLRAILVKDYQLAPDTVTMQADLEALGIDSLGVAELLFSIEDEFRVTLPPEPAELNSVGEVVSYIDALVAGRKPAALRPFSPGGMNPVADVNERHFEHQHRASFPRSMTRVPQPRRVAVTGMGVVSPLGDSAQAAFDAAAAGQSGVGMLSTTFARRLVSPIAAAAEFDPSARFESRQLRMLDRVSQFALVAAKQALVQAGSVKAAHPAERCGVFVGTGMGGTHTIDDGYQTLYGDDSDRIKPFTVLMGMYNAPAAWIGIEHGLLGPNLTYTTACSSSAVAIGEAWLRVASGSLDMAVAGGAEAPLSFGAMKAWEALHTLAPVDAARPSASCKPFSKNRCGMVLGEGAAMLVLEAWDEALARGAVIVGEVLGYGLSNDAEHITRPSVHGQARAMRSALLSANLNPEDIDAINAHGTGTLANDSTETAAIKAVFGAHAHRVPISATKALHGHMLGATGALECVLSLMSMRHRVALPTMHLDAADPECDLDYVPQQARRGVEVRTMLSNSFAFGGTNAVLAIGLGNASTLSNAARR